MIVNKETLTAISKGFSKIFNNAIGTADTTYRKIATVIDNVKSITVEYAWLGGTPKMREWIGDRVLRDLKAHGYSITKKDYEATIEVDRDTIEYDQLGIVKPRIQQLAYEGDQHYDETLYELLEKNDNCYDGKPFFSANHQVGEEGSMVELSNIGTKKLNQASFLAARKEMRGLVGDTGKSLKIKPNLLVVPPELEAEAIKILKADKLDNGQSNITKDMADYLVVDDLTDADAWYLMDTTKPIKPLVLQINKSIKFTAMDSMTDENVFMRKSFRYGTDSQDNVGYGLWQLAYKSTGEEA